VSQAEMYTILSGETPLDKLVCTPWDGLQPTFPGEIPLPLCGTPDKWGTCLHAETEMVSGVYVYFLRIWIPKNTNPFVFSLSWDNTHILYLESETSIVFFFLRGLIPPKMSLRHNIFGCTNKKKLCKPTHHSYLACGHACTRGKDMWLSCLPPKNGPATAHFSSVALWLWLLCFYAEKYHVLKFYSYVKCKIRYWFIR
jgi:hypothetical protein